MVVANAVAALSEIHDRNPSAKYFDMNPGTVSKLLTALNECTEWGQIFIVSGAETGRNVGEAFLALARLLARWPFCKEARFYRPLSGAGRLIRSGVPPPHRPTDPPSQLDSLAIYHPEDQRELQSICERVTPRLQHVNAAVVLSAVKVILKLLEGITDLEYKAQLLTKLAPPLVTLLSSEPEVRQLRHRF